MKPKQPETMNNYLIYRTDDDIGWDEYIGFVVCAKDKRQASKFIKQADERDFVVWKIKNIGESVYKKPRILLESFNAG
jgi:hypothetical protein